MTDTAVSHPEFHHINLCTIRLGEMIAWHAEVLGRQVVVVPETGPQVAWAR